LVATWSRTGLSVGAGVGALLGAILVGTLGLSGSVIGILLALAISLVIGSVIGGVVGLAAGALTGKVLETLSRTPLLAPAAPHRRCRTAIASVTTSAAAGLLVQLLLFGWALPESWYLVYLPAGAGALAMGALSLRASST
jgi:hypothetical protein